MNTHILSKSSFLKGIQCEKQLYLYKHHYELMDPIDASTQTRFSNGWSIGNLARELFPGGVDTSPKSPSEYDTSVNLTLEQLLLGTDIIYEAAFIYDDVLAAVDILVKCDSKWKAFEVKSSTCVKDTHKLDAALQYYVLNGAGIELADFSIIYINNKYVRKGNLNLKELFTIESVFKESVKKQGYISKETKRLKKMVTSGNIPSRGIGEQCDDPYKCSFWNQCWNKIPQDSVFEIGGMRKTRKFELYREGIIKIEDIPDDFRLSDSQRIQVDCARNSTPHIIADEISSFIKSLRYPLYFLDFETFNPAVPLFDFARPYEQIPFQFSLHSLEKPDGEAIHKEYLSESGRDPRPELVRKLLEAVKGEGDIVAFNATFEITRLKELARLFPEFQVELDLIIGRMKDLMEPFRTKNYYLPEFKGGYSIKNVLPVLVPELSYSELAIGDGSTASSAFESLYTEKDSIKIQETRDQLLEYCKLDTLAMVKILEKLKINYGN